MPEEIFAMLMVVLVGGMGLTGFKMFLNYRVKRLAQQGGEHSQALEESLADVREHLRQLQLEMADLGERVDFAERLLTRAREPEA